MKNLNYIRKKIINLQIEDAFDLMHDIVPSNEKWIINAIYLNQAEYTLLKRQNISGLISPDIFIAAAEWL